jgi:hypothetical protein
MQPRAVDGAQGEVLEARWIALPVRDSCEDRRRHHRPGGISRCSRQSARLRFFPRSFQHTGHQRHSFRIVGCILERHLFPFESIIPTPDAGRRTILEIIAT